jgi:hypothetical protein
MKLKNLTKTKHYVDVDSNGVPNFMQTPSATNLAKKSGLKRHDDFTKSSTNLLISLKTIKMKKKHKASSNGVCMNGGINLQAGIDQHLNKNEKGLSIKSIGITFANLFKPSVKRFLLILNFKSFYNNFILFPEKDRTQYAKHNHRYKHHLLSKRVPTQDS